MSPEIFFGLKITLVAPYFFAIFSYFFESVETIISLINFDLIHDSIDQANKGFPLSSLIFLSLMLFEPDLAGIKATMV